MGLRLLEEARESPRSQYHRTRAWKRDAACRHTTGKAPKSLLLSERGRFKCNAEKKQPYGIDQVLKMLTPSRNCNFRAHLVEVSPVLRSQQAQTLGCNPEQAKLGNATQSSTVVPGIYGIPFQWHNELAQVPTGMALRVLPHKERLSVDC